MQSLLKKTSFYLLLGFLPLASNFLLAPLFTRVLSPIEYGLIALAVLFQNYFNVFIDLGLKGAFSRYYFRYFKRKAIVKVLLSTVLLSILGIAGIVYFFFLFFGEAIFTIVFKNELFTFQKFGHFICVLALNALLNGVILSYFRNEENLKMYALVSLSTFLLMSAGAVIGVLVYDYGALGSIIGKMTGSGIVVLLFLVIFFYKNGFHFETRLLKPLLKYGLPLIPFAFLSITIYNLDRFFIERYFDLEELGKYNVAFLISTIPFIMLNSFQSSMSPGIMKLLETSNIENKSANYLEINRNFRIILMFMVLMLLGMLTFSGFFIMFYVGPEYREIIQYLPILIFAFVPMVYQYMFGTLLFFHYQSKLLPIISAITLVGAIILNFALIPLVGIYGVACAVLGKNIIYALATYVAVRIKGFYIRDMFYLGKYQWLALVIVSTTALTMTLIHIYPTHYQWDTFIVGAVSIIFILTLFKREFNLMLSFLQNILSFKNNK